VAQPELRAALEALDLADHATTNGKRTRALAALEAAREGLITASQDKWHREAAAGQWSNARGQVILRRIRTAASRLEQRSTNQPEPS
jgi:hypothetical protein